MPRNESLPVLTCDLCNLSSKNQFIFKRHRQRCLRDRGIPSQRWVAAQKARARSAEAKQDAEGSYGEEEDDNEEEAGDDVMAGDDKPASPRPRANTDIRSSLRGISASSETHLTSRLRSRSTSDLDATNTDAPAMGSGLEESMEMDAEDQPLAPRSDKELLPPPQVSRHYGCRQCGFTTNKSREFLYHKIQQHRARIQIFCCTVCEYASEYKHKITRHMSNSHSLPINKDEVAPEYSNLPLPSAGTGVKRLLSLGPAQRAMKRKRMVSSKVAPRSSQSLESLLGKLRAKAKVTDASLSSLFTSADSGSGEGELFKCKLCLFTAKCKNKVLRHLQACHINARLFHCNLCSFKTHSKIEFYAHKKKHTNKNTTMFKCTECSYATEFRPNFDRHMIQHGCNKPNKCSLCSYATDHEGALKRHVTSHHPNTAENQSLVLARDEGTAPLRMEDDDDDDDDGIEPEADDGLESDGFRCPLCTLKYRRCSDLNRHMKSKHNTTRKDFLEQTGADVDEEILDIDDDDFNDDIEVEEVSESEDSEDEGQTLSELRVKEQLKGVKKINKKCSYCSYIAKWPSDLRRHMRVHSVVKRFKCAMCWKKYKYLGDLNVHMRRDHEVSPDQELKTPQKVSTIAIKKNSPRLFRCPACPFFTKVKVDMDRHSHTHTEAKTYSCKLCSYETYWRGDMGRHLYRKHPKEVSKDEDVKEFFLFRPERRAICKGGSGLASRGRTPEADDPMEEGTPERQMEPTPEKMKVEEGNEDSILDSLSLSDSLSNCSESTVDKDGNRIYKCQLCPFFNAQAHKVKSHMETHLNLKQFMCPVCGQRGNWKYDIRKHVQAKHPACGQEVVCLSVEEAKATIQEYLATRPNIKRDHHLTYAGSGPVSTMPSAPSPQQQKIAEQLGKASQQQKITEQLGKASQQQNRPAQGKASEAQSKPLQQQKKGPQQQLLKKKVFEYKCSHCDFRSRVRLDVSKHQRNGHEGQFGLGILVKPIFVSVEEEARKKEEATEVEDELMREDQKEEEQKKDVLKTEEVTKEEMEEALDKPLTRSRDQGEMPKEMYNEQMEVGEDEFQEEVVPLFRCSECGKEGVSKGAIKKHYNYIHPSSEVRIISVADGVEFNYYTGLPTSTPVSHSPLTCDVTSVGGDTSLSPCKLSDPKKHGYVKPFQCSVCNQRSNWKWDIKKHLRMKHPDDFGYVIVLQLDQARATCPDRQSPSTQLSVSGTNSVYSDPESSNMSDGSSFVSPDMPYKAQEMLLGRYRRYKCSGCGYRSNWRTDICRHIERRHKDGRSKVIFMDVEEAKESFMDYHYNPPNVNPHTPGVALSSPHKRSPRSSPFKLPSPTKSSPKKRPPVTGKVWHCPKCPFVSAVKSHILSHMQNHGMKPFHCTVCGMTSRFRSPMYRHIRKQHNSTNYNAFAKIIIKFNKTSVGQGSLPLSGGSMKFVEAYLCRRCVGNTMETPSKEEMMKHLLSEHGSTDAVQALKIKKKLGDESREWDSANTNESGEEGTKGVRAKRYFCTICPYRTDKRSMLIFHHAYHQPTVQNKYKCKYCPYYVCASRLLHQHMSLHEEFVDDKASIESAGWRAAAEKTPPSSPSKRNKMGPEGTPKRHRCEKCPYTTNSKNDFLYHKQFHRPKPAAEYKCEHCDYWVTHRRLLRQHMRLHNKEFRQDSIAGSPTKSLASDASAVLDAVEIAAIKQKMISNKITASLSSSPAVSPMKIAAQCSAGNRPGFIMHNGAYKKLQHCRKCPYTNIRARNVRLHELMHGFRRSEHPLNKCPHCDYYVGAKGLLSHHMKVHLQQYRPDPGDSTTFNLEKQENAPGVSRISSEPDEPQDHVFASPQIPLKYKVDTLLEISRFKKYSCEKCPYASGKRAHFVRHMELHGSKQRHTCQYCDYSVPSVTLLVQHQRIHLMPNQNLLASQSFSNLQHLKEVPADVALASALPPTDSSEPVTISVIHDHLELYENDDNNTFDMEPKKLYRCDRCPYANVRRDHLLTHLRFHLTKSTFQCPYCDYSAPKQQLLTQHIRVHFCPLPELSDWLIENGQNERAQEVNDIDLTQALEVAENFQTSTKRKLNRLTKMKEEAEGAQDDGEVPAKKLKTDANDNGGKSETSSAETPSNKATSSKDSKKTEEEPQPSTSTAADAAGKTPKAKGEEEKKTENGNIYICQYCDREFPSSKLLIAHEMQHLIGNHFEFSDDDSSNSKAASPGPAPKAIEAKEDRQHVKPVTQNSHRREEDMDTDQQKAENASTKQADKKHAENSVRGDVKKDSSVKETSAEGVGKNWDKVKTGEKEEEKDKEKEKAEKASKEKNEDEKASKEKNEDEKDEKASKERKKEEEEGESGEDSRGSGSDRRYRMRRRQDTNCSSPSLSDPNASTSQNGDK
ncbi:zinc finger protein 142-like isoform X2 [Littorina saxatilis]|uniref:C2H2-type domain-containing protein n=1 Tax=Littorina saxatilis TaxID=31220 RepID=A0AAN9BZS6_9CAEN